MKGKKLREIPEKLGQIQPRELELTLKGWIQTLLLAEYPLKG